MASLSKVIFLIWGLVRSWKLLETPVFQEVVDIAMLFCMGVKTCQFGTYCSKDRIFDALRLLWQFLSSSLVYLFCFWLFVCLFVLLLLFQCLVPVFWIVSLLNFSLRRYLSPCSHSINFASELGLKTHLGCMIEPIGVRVVLPGRSPFHFSKWEIGI